MSTHYTPSTHTLWDELPHITTGKPTMSYAIVSPGLIAYLNTVTGFWNVDHQLTHRSILLGVREKIARQFCTELGAVLYREQILDVESAAEFRSIAPLWLDKWVKEQRMRLEWLDPTPYMTGHK